MYIENIKFLNENVKTKIEVMIKENSDIIGALNSLMGIYPEYIIKDIKVVANEYIINIMSGSSEKEAIVEQNGLIDSIYYIDNPERKFKSAHRQVIARKRQENTLEYEFIDDKGLDYLIVLTKYKDMVVGNIIEELLDENHSIANIKDIYYALEKCLDLENVLLIIKSIDDKSFLEMMKGNIVKYQSTEEFQNHIYREYLGKDGKFYFDETVSREISNDHMPFVKKKVK